mmetsp:Transcript_10443/g.45363  ORF Transcript_10443/g.45363 Transcript_10443/m.45363 type:complete len:280 (+) Transcript_10443:683-1522(+)
MTERCGRGARWTTPTGIERGTARRASWTFAGADSAPTRGCESTTRDPSLPTPCCTRCAPCSGALRGRGCSRWWRVTSPRVATCSRCTSGWCGIPRRLGWARRISHVWRIHPRRRTAPAASPLTTASRAPRSSVAAFREVSRRHSRVVSAARTVAIATGARNAGAAGWARTSCLRRRSSRFARGSTRRAGSTPTKSSASSPAVAGTSRPRRSSRTSCPYSSSTRRRTRCGTPTRTACAIRFEATDPTRARASAAAITFGWRVSLGCRSFIGWRPWGRAGA